MSLQYFTTFFCVVVCDNILNLRIFIKTYFNSSQNLKFKLENECSASIFKDVMLEYIRKYTNKVENGDSFELRRMVDFSSILFFIYLFILPEFESIKAAIKIINRWINLLINMYHMNSRMRSSFFQMCSPYRVIKLRSCSIFR